MEEPIEARIALGTNTPIDKKASHAYASWDPTKNKSVPIRPRCMHDTTIIVTPVASHLFTPIAPSNMAEKKASANKIGKSICIMVHSEYAMALSGYAPSRFAACISLGNDIRIAGILHRSLHGID
jgi:hypothetical protein